MQVAPADAAVVSQYKTREGSNMANKKLVLDMGEMEDAFLADGTFMAIAANMPITRFCWLLQQKFDLDFVRKPDDDICIKKRNGESRYYAIYEYCVPLSETRHLLCKLKTNDDCLFQEIKPMDFLWVMLGDDTVAMANVYLHYLRKIEGVQLAQVIDSGRIKNINYLIC